MATSSLLAAFGVNYHNACQHGVILENCPNFDLQCQVIGRLWRLCQKEKVFWKILQTQDTFEPWVEIRNMRAYVSTVEAEAVIQTPKETNATFQPESAGDPSSDTYEDPDAHELAQLGREHVELIIRKVVFGGLLNLSAGEA
ncbi:hypothetical protein LZ31DRAFT_610963 [Colletotrichum somersetense]|nr:hypothetical protein LZ31DRAFT_610963 [Colletotrichum somersetense]